MRLQKATRYGLYAVLELAREPDRQLSASDIADRYGISINHLAKVMRDLGRAGLVEAARGAGGGYRFTGNARRTEKLPISRSRAEIRREIGSVIAPPQLAARRCRAPTARLRIGKSRRGRKWCR